jgi:hypothetical protein
MQSNLFAEFTNPFIVDEFLTSIGKKPLLLLGILVTQIGCYTNTQDRISFKL